MRHGGGRRDHPAIETDRELASQIDRSCPNPVELTWDALKVTREAELASSPGYPTPLNF
jgi:hypothetical protein